MGWHRLPFRHGLESMEYRSERSIMFRLPAAATSTFVLTMAGLSAQTVRKVGTSPNAQFATIQPALDASSAGDIVLIEAGTYAGFTLTGKALSILADAGASVQISSTCSVSAIASGSVLMRGLMIRAANGPAVGAATHGLQVHNCTAPVHLEQCEIVGGQGQIAGTGLISTSVNSLSIHATLVRGGEGPFNFILSGFGGSGLKAINSQVSAWTSTFVGGVSTPAVFDVVTAPPGADGANLDSCTGYFLNCHFQGSNGTDLAAATIPPSKGGDAFDGTNSIAGAYALPACSFQPGSGGSDAIWGMAASGLPVNPPSVQAPSADNVLSFAIGTPVREGALLPLNLNLGSPGFAYMAYDTETAVNAPIPGIGSPFLLNFLTSVLEPFPTGPAFTAGGYSVNLVVPEIGAGSVGKRFFAQLIFVNSAITAVQFGPLTTAVFLESSL